MRFRFPWRDYQARVISAFRLYLADQRVHIVAAPGSGKTTLGLEMFRQLGKPALILSPTRVIRNQWIDRLRDFLPDSESWPPQWASRSLDDPQFLTSITYQALHTKYRDDLGDADTDDEVAAEEEGEIQTTAIDRQEISALVQSIKAAGIQTLILDEAHHLRAEWWKALSEVVDATEGMAVVSLTATPPYDSNSTQWKRYEALCGVIDEEISVPELVKAGTLCPHQDFVWTVVPTENEKAYLQQYVSDVKKTTQELLVDATLERAIREHAWLVATADNENDIFSQPDQAIALLAYLKKKELPLPIYLMDLLDLRNEDVPELSDYWWQEIVGAYLYRQQPWPSDGEVGAHRKKLARSLRDRHLLRRRELQLSDARLVKRHMTQSSAKVQACVDIYRGERKVRGATLRQVILTDYIRDEGVASEEPHHEKVLGAWPIFSALANSLDDSEQSHCALLTGRLVVVPECVVALLDSTSIWRPLDQIEGYRVLVSSAINPVTLLTEMLEAGRIHVLVGTRALLGEGWDAPCINSLILASSVGSYMLTNQMRGRAIRTDSNDPEKVASIWHIVAIVLDRQVLDVLQPYRVFWPGLADFRDLENRFSTFVGIHNSEPRIENALLRLELPYVTRRHDRVSGAEHMALKPTFFTSAARLESGNGKMLDRLRRIREIDGQWQAAIGSGTMGQVVPSVSPDSPPSARPFHFRRTFRYFLLMAMIAFAGVFFASVDFIPRVGLGVVLTVATLWALPKFLIAARLLIRHLPVDGTIHQIGLAARDTLCATGIIENTAARLKVKSYSVAGQVYVNLEGGTFHEKSVFADCMEEILGSIDNPRYLIVRYGRSFGVRREDFHSVPSRIGIKKEFATVFHQAWLRYVGDAELVYTRTAETRKILLHARARAFSSGTKKAVKRMDRWL